MAEEKDQQAEVRGEFNAGQRGCAPEKGEQATDAPQTDEPTEGPGDEAGGATGQGPV